MELLIIIIIIGLCCGKKKNKKSNNLIEEKEIIPIEEEMAIIYSILGNNGKPMTIAEILEKVPLEFNFTAHKCVARLHKLVDLKKVNKFEFNSKIHYEAILSKEKNEFISQKQFVKIFEKDCLCNETEKKVNEWVYGMERTTNNFEIISISTNEDEVIIIYKKN